jgi:hypothetical protein
MPTVVVPINYLAVFAAAAASMVIGFLWYGPLLGKPWVKEMGFSKEKMEKAKKESGKSYPLMFLGSLVMSYVLAHALVFASTFLGVEGAPAGLQTGFWNWLGFVAPVTLGSVLWEGKSYRLWMINNGYYLITLLAMGTVLAIWP